MAKLKKILFVALSSIGLARNMTPQVEASELNVTKVNEINEKKNSFEESIKVVSESEQIVDRIDRE